MTSGTQACGCVVTEDPCRCGRGKVKVARPAPQSECPGHGFSPLCEECIGWQSVTFTEATAQKLAQLLSRDGAPVQTSALLQEAATTHVQTRADTPRSLGAAAAKIDRVVSTAGHFDAALRDLEADAAARDLMRDVLELLRVQIRLVDLHPGVTAVAELDLDKLRDEDDGPALLPGPAEGRPREEARLLFALEVVRILDEAGVPITPSSAGALADYVRIMLEVVGEPVSNDALRPLLRQTVKIYAKHKG